MALITGGVTMPNIGMVRTYEFRYKNLCVMILCNTQPVWVCIGHI